MDKMKIFIKKANPHNWYSSYVGKSILVFKNKLILRDRLVYEYVGLPNHVIFEDDCLVNEQLRDRKLKRINKY